MFPSFIYLCIAQIRSDLLQYTLIKFAVTVLSHFNSLIFAVGTLKLILYSCEVANTSNDRIHIFIASFYQVSLQRNELQMCE